MLKALSLLQPWASLIATGAKTVETRSWGTHYRGPLAIHASKGLKPEIRALCLNEPYKSHLPLGVPETLPFGAIVAVAELAIVVRIPRETWAAGLSTNERAFGDFRAGRYAWQLRNVQRLAEPIPCRGSLGLWDVPAEVLALLEAAHA